MIRRVACFGMFAIMGMCGWCQEMATKPRVSPLEFGLKEAKDGEARYRVLYATHSEARERGVDVDYSGIDTIEIEVPADAECIPLTRHNDFGGVVLVVRNNTKNHTLFGLRSMSKSIDIEKERLDRGDFGDIEVLKRGEKLLILSDETPWVGERIGYGSPAMRRDILLLKEGVAQNSPVAAWNTPATKARCSYVETDGGQKEIENLTIHRDRRSSYISFCISIENQNNVVLRNVRVTTPKSKLLHDGVIGIHNCTNVRVEDVTIEGTYSRAGVSTGYGYGFSMNNDWNTHFERVRADGNWGVFGTNCLSQTTLRDCDINRFDIHCYGRDAKMVGCRFRNKQTQFSSMYGTVEFDSCAFIDCIPVRIRSSYNAYTPFDIVMRDCVFEPTRRYHALVNVMMLDTNDNARPELKEKCIPNVRIENMRVEMPVGLGKIILFNPTGSTTECTSRVWHHLERVEIEGLRCVRNGKLVKTRLLLTDRPIRVERFEGRMKGVELGGGEVTEGFLREK